MNTILEPEVEELPNGTTDLIKIDFNKLPVNLKVTEIEIERLKQYTSLTIIDINDITGYNVVDLRRKEVKKIRTSLKNYAKNLREPAKVFQEKVIAEERRITAELESIETNLENKQRLIDDEKERLRVEEEEKKAAKLQARVTALAGYGVTDLHLDYIKSLSDADFSVSVSRAKEAFEKAAEEKRLAEEEARKQQEENERLQQQLKEAHEAAELAAKTLVIANTSTVADTTPPAPEPPKKKAAPKQTAEPDNDQVKLNILLTELSYLVDYPECDKEENRKVVLAVKAHINNAIELLKKAIA